MDPEEQFAGVMWWAFKGQTLSDTTVTSSLGYGGPLLESGRITVTFATVHNQQPTMVSTDVTVAPRTGDPWTQARWEGEIRVTEDVPPGPLCGSVAVGGTGGHGWLKGAQDPDKCEAAFLLADFTPAPSPPEGGPSGGDFWVAMAEANYKGTTHIHPEARPGAFTRPLSDSAQAEECREALDLDPGAPVEINLWHFNASCKAVPNMDQFIPASLTHELQHFENRRAALLSTPENNAFVRLEKLVANTLQDRDAAFDQLKLEITDAGIAADQTEPTGNFPPPYWVWDVDFGGFRQITTGF